MTDVAALVEGLRHHLPVARASYPASRHACGLVIIDAVNGFCTVGAGNLAPRAPDDRIAGMVVEINRLASEFAAARKPILAFLDTHEPGKPEPPYPPHCERGSGEENFVQDLAWLERCPEATLIRKDCIDCFVAATEAIHGQGFAKSHNKLVDWIAMHRLHTVIVTGICTDICVMDCVLPLLSARNHGMTPSVRDVVVYEPGIATFDLPRAAAEAAGLPATSSHPREVAHHMGLYFMASRGAVLASELA